MSSNSNHEHNINPENKDVGLGSRFKNVRPATVTSSWSHKYDAPSFEWARNMILKGSSLRTAAKAVIFKIFSAFRGKRSEALAMDSILCLAHMLRNASVEPKEDDHLFLGYASVCKHATLSLEQFNDYMCEAALRDPKRVVNFLAACGYNRNLERQFLKEDHNPLAKSRQRLLRIETKKLYSSTDSMRAARRFRKCKSSIPRCSIWSWVSSSHSKQNLSKGTLSHRGVGARVDGSSSQGSARKAVLSLRKNRLEKE